VFDFRSVIAPIGRLSRCPGLVLLIVLLAGLAGQPGQAAPDPPQFASLRADRVNVRTGPGMRYPIVWVFVRQGLPVEITAAFDLWRRIRDIDGEVGWIHTSLLSRERAAIITGEARPLYRDPDSTSPPVALAEAGVVGRVLQCREAWCELSIGRIRGWTHRTSLWGVYPSEEIE
jgi:SH3-like domain-containing protein